MEISIIITNYNYEKYIARAIRSAINQSFNLKEYEILVVDDASTDNSRSIIESFGNKVKAIFNDNNIGLAASCNKAIQLAMGKYIVRLDADDFINSDFLKMHQLFLSHNKGDMDATSSDYYEIDLNENVLRRRNGDTWPIACGVMYRLDHLIEMGLYDETLPREDVDFRNRFLKKYRIYNIPVPLYRYTMHENSMTHSVKKLK